jgi:hypothetical protein
VYSLSNEGVTGERASSGGVTSLLKMVRSQCGAAVVIAALRGPSGEHSIMVAGGAGDETVSKPAKKLVRHLWDGTLEGGAFVTVRQLRLPKGLAPGMGRQAEVAVVHIGDTGGQDRPDLLCVVGGAGEPFSPAQLDTVGSMAARLASYQAARGAMAETAPAPAPAPAPVAVPEAPISVPPVTAPPVGSPPPHQQPPAADSLRQPPVGYSPLQPAPVYVPPAQPAPPAAVVPGPAPAPAYQPHPSDLARGVPAPALAPSVAPSDPLGALFSPDPLTGLSSVPSLLGRLGENLGRLPVVGGSVGLVFLRVVPAAGMARASDAHINAVADALQQHVRPDDMVCRLDDHTFGVVSALSPRSCDVSVIERRLVAATQDAVEHSVSGLDILSAHASVDVDHPIGPEALLSQVMSELGDP